MKVLTDSQLDEGTEESQDVPLDVRSGRCDKARASMRGDMESDVIALVISSTHIPLVAYGSS